METDPYKEALRDGCEAIDSLLADPGIQRALNQTLPNDAEETDETAWVEGSKRFAKQNADLLKSWLLR